MIAKNVFIEFADPRIKAIDHISDISEAVSNAQWNLYRYKINLHLPKIINNMVILAIDIPEDLAEKINFGRRLRGISKYLLANHGDFYKKYLIGTRLLNYIEMET